MDATVRKRVAEIQQALEEEGLRISMADPVAKMMLVALAHQADEIGRKMDTSIDRLSYKFANQVLMNSSLGPLPAISLLKIGNGKEYASYTINERVAFSLKTAKCNFRPLFKTRIIPGKVIGYYADGLIYFPFEKPVRIKMGDILHQGEMWIAYEAANEVDSFEGMVFALNHPLSPDSLMKAEIGKVSYPITLAMEEDIFCLSDNYMLTEYWKRHLVYNRLWIYRFGAADIDTPVLTSDMPGWLYDMYEPETLSRFTARRYIWIKLSAKSGTAVPSNSHIELNCVPVANFDVGTVKLSYTEPIKALDNPKNGAQFLEIVPEPEISDDFFIRDFDVNQYDNSRIAEDILNLYRHYVDDYFAFVDSNSLNDGAALRNLRMAMVQVSDALSEVGKEHKQYNGTYIIRSPRNNSHPVVVSYITTQGGRGNLLKAGMQLSSSFTATGDVIALTDAAGGRNKVTGTLGRTELARFTANANDRLFTEIDILQYCKVELLRAFGDEVMRFCEVSLTHNSYPVCGHIERILNIRIVFTSERFYHAAKEINFEQYLLLNITLRKSFGDGVSIDMISE